MKNNKPKRQYVNNVEFFEAIIAHRAASQQAIDAGKELPRIPDYIGVCISSIANRLSLKPCFINYSFRDEMIEDGISNCFEYFHDFNPEKGTNAFAYFTQIIYFAFLRRLYKEEKNRYILYKNFHEVIGTDMSGLVDSNNNSLMPAQIYDNISAFMERFERKEEDKKQKRKKAKEEGLDKFYSKEVL